MAPAVLTHRSPPPPPPQIVILLCNFLVSEDQLAPNGPPMSVPRKYRHVEQPQFPANKRGSRSRPKLWRLGHDINQTFQVERAVHLWTMEHGQGRIRCR